MAQRCLYKHVFISLFPGCNTNVDLVLIVDSSESIVASDPYGSPLYNWNRVSNYVNFLMIREMCGGKQLFIYQCRLTIITMAIFGHMTYIYS